MYANANTHTRAYTPGFKATLATLDSAVARLPAHEPVVIITASFEGEPADNAARFVEWLKGLSGGGANNNNNNNNNNQDGDGEQQLRGVKFAVFGCGNTDWVTTYQRVPKLIDRILAERGATRLVDLGAGNAASDDFFEAFDRWETRLWETLAEVRPPRRFPVAYEPGPKF